MIYPTPKGTTSMSSVRTASTAIATSLLLLLTGCATTDDGATVREIGTEDGAASSGSGSASGSGSSSGSAPASGSGSSSGSASGTADASAEGPTAADGGYAYASNVDSHRLVVADVCDVKDLLDADPIDFDAARTVYTDGGNSVNSDGEARTLGGFASRDDRLHGYDEYYASSTPLDDFVTAALDGSDIFADTADAVRAQGVEKGIQNQVMVAWVVHELNTAVGKAEDGDIDPEDGAPHNWDEGWAFYHGAEPGCAPFATATSRAENFGTLTADGDAPANVAILTAMDEGRDALLEGDVEAAAAARDEVLRNVVITYSQAAIRYATLAPQDIEAGNVETAAEHTVEGLAFWRVIEPLVAGDADVDAINEVLDLQREPQDGDGDTVRAALEPAWESLGITEDEIGTLQ